VGVTCEEINVEDQECKDEGQRGEQEIQIHYFLIIDI
jgi:hypothetical protein